MQHHYQEHVLTCYIHGTKCEPYQEGWAGYVLQFRNMFTISYQSQHNNLFRRLHYLHFMRHVSAVHPSSGKLL
jgi:hypothetical protein